MLRLYDYFESGNAYKVRLLLAQLGIAFERVELDILKGETRAPAFLAKNPNHRIPLLEWPDGRLPTNTSGGGMSEAYVHGFNLVLEGVRQMRGSSTSQVEGADTCIVTSGEGVPTSALLLRS